MIFEKYSTVSNNRGGLNKSGGLTDSLNINKREDPDKSGGGGGGLKNFLGQKWLILGVPNNYL